ncbi:hypothetical protein [Aliikangiella sp. G2MR2-5]|uniref:hypothetical protein n=1 Tax=Aliikangiella sp. G2MR2-5 TaxID=2788943 RepID=UPI0018A9AD00|nr:hypothetical protein [Aliikangiella sp. G2MR2-5]
MALNEAEVAQIRRAGEHFKKVLRETFEFFPRSARSIAGLARWTKVNKSTCQRMVQALTKTKDGIDVIITLPGVSGLKQIAAEIEKRIEVSEEIAEFNQMVVEYEDLILSFAPSHSELKRQLVKFLSKSSKSLDAYNRKLKKSAFEVNCEISGESVDTYFGVAILRFNEQDPEYLDEFIISAKLGVELTKFARPYVQNFGGNLDEIQISDPKLLDKSNYTNFISDKNGEYLLKEFSTNGIEKTYAGVSNLKNGLIFNHTKEPIECGKFDITLAHLDTRTLVNPIKSEIKVVCQSLLQRSPAKKLVLATLVDKRLDQKSTVQCGCYPSSVKIHEKEHTPEDLWSERFSESLEIKLFKPEEKILSEKVKIECADELIDLAFRLLNEKTENFVGYFIEAEYPLWLTSHRFYYKF